MTLTPRQHNVISYLGACVVMPSVALASGNAEERSLFLALWILHFARRSAEAMWVHRYSKPQFPWLDAGIEYLYYWGFGAWIGATLPAFRGTPLAVAGLLVFTLGELGNARAHWLLRQLRSTHDGKSIPRGFLFEWVSCPHYLFEITSWLGFALATQILPAAAFALVGSVILVFWAHARHQAYRKVFDGEAGQELYPRGRRAIFPGVY